MNEEEPKGAAPEPCVHFSSERIAMYVMNSTDPRACPPRYICKKTHFTKGPDRKGCRPPGHRTSTGHPCQPGRACYEAASAVKAAE